MNGYLAFLLWTAFMVACWTFDVPTMILAACAAGIVVVARQDWRLGRRPFDKIDSL